MCGISGILSYIRSDNEIVSLSHSMIKKLDHRGPDGRGIFNDKNVSLGHTRLSIIDLSNAGKQPMIDERGYIISYNGELYNYQILKKELELNGEVFKSNSDTEVVLKAFIHWGVKSLDRFNGIFAFAIYNKNEKSIFLARDRVGVKTLYYDTSKKEFKFASEIKSLLEANNNSEFDYGQIPFYLKYGYFPREYTPLKNVKQLQPGHFIIWENGNLTNDCYWDASSYKVDRDLTKKREEDIILNFRHLIRDSVKMQMASDVPIGSFLSGGIDSGLVTSQLQRLSSNKVDTFTLITPDEYGKKEGILASNLAKKLDTKHNEIYISSDDLVSNWKYIFSHFDLPFNDTSALPTYLISKFSSEKVKVVMSGDGGDEQWGGYLNYQKFKIIEFINIHFPYLFNKKNKFISQVLMKIFSIISKSITNKMNFYSNIAMSEIKYWHSMLDNQIKNYNHKSIYGDRLKKYSDNTYENFKLSSIENYLDGMMLNDLKLFMVDSVLRKVDMMSMVNGLEVRVPLLDHRIVEKSLSVPNSLKVSLFNNKIIGKKIAKSDLPNVSINAKKMGFSIPIDSWIRNEFRDTANDIIRSNSFKNRGILDQKYILKILDDHDKNKSDNGKFIMGILILENWLINNKIS